MEGMVDVSVSGSVDGVADGCMDCSEDGVVICVVEDCVDNKVGMGVEDVVDGSMDNFLDESVGCSTGNETTDAEVTAGTDGCAVELAGKDGIAAGSSDVAAELPLSLSSLQVSCKSVFEVTGSERTLCIQGSQRVRHSAASDPVVRSEV